MHQHRSRGVQEGRLSAKYSMKRPNRLPGTSPKQDRLLRPSIRLNCNKSGKTQTTRFPAAMH